MRLTSAPGALRPLLRMRERERQAMINERSAEIEEMAPPAWLTRAASRLVRPLPKSVVNAVAPGLAIALGAGLMTAAGALASLALYAVARLALVLVHHSHLFATHPAWAAYLVIGGPIAVAGYGVLAYRAGARRGRQSR